MQTERKYDCRRSSTFTAGSPWPSWPDIACAGEDVVTALNRIIAKRTAPKYLFVDNGSEFSGQMLGLWAYHHQTRIDFSRPGKPTDNCFIETFNGSLRDECLNVHWFTSLAEVRAVVEAWRIDYNEIRPHMALKTKPRWPSLGVRSLEVQKEAIDRPNPQLESVHGIQADRCAGYYG